MTETSSPSAEHEPVQLKDPVLAGFLAWLVPGLGHWYQGRIAKACLFFVCIIGTFVYGLYLGGSEELGWGRVVYASWRDNDRRLPYLCQIGIGLPALPAVVQAARVRNGKEPWFSGFMAPPRLDEEGPGPADRPTVSKLHKQLHRYFELGTVYTMIAGLLNVLAVYDACCGPVFTEPRKKKPQKAKDPEADEKPDGEHPAPGASP